MSDESDFFDLAGTKAHSVYVSVRMLNTHPEDSEYGLFSCMAVELRTRRDRMRFSITEPDIAETICSSGAASRADLLALRNLIAGRIAKKLDIQPEHVVIYMLRLSADGNVYTYQDRESI